MESQLGSVPLAILIIIMLYVLTGELFKVKNVLINS